VAIEVADGERRVAKRVAQPCSACKAAGVELTSLKHHAFIKLLLKTLLIAIAGIPSAIAAGSC